jgi:hypothetical protein
MSPLGPGVSKAPTPTELRGRIYSPAVLAELGGLLDAAEAKTAKGSLESRRVAFFRREYLAPLADAMEKLK